MDEDLKKIKQYTKTPMKELWRELGDHLLMTGKATVPMHDILGARRDATYDAKKWFAENRDRIYEAICIKFDYCEHKKRYRVNRIIELIAASSPFLVPLTGHIIPAIIASTIVLRQGFDTFCKCDNAGHLVEKAIRLEHNPDQMRDLLLRAIEESPLHPSVHYLLGLAYDYLNEVRLATDYYKQAIELNPEDFYALNNLGYLLLSSSGDAKQALIYLERAITFQPTNDAVNHSYGLALLRVGKSYEAVTFLERAFQANPLPNRERDLEEARKQILSHSKDSIEQACRCCQEKIPFERPRICPECHHIFKGNGWDGVDAHWRSKHQHMMSYENFWSTLCSRHKRA